MLSFAEIFPEIVKNPTKFKIHFATVSYNNDSPLQAYFRGEFKEWQESQTKRNFEREFIISFILYQPSEWIFAGIYKKLSSKKKNNHWIYDTELLETRSDLIGRLIIIYDKPFRASYLKIEKYYTAFHISKILKDRLSFNPVSVHQPVNKKYNGLNNKNLNTDVINKIKSRIGNKVSFKYPGEEGDKSGVLKDRAVIESYNELGYVPYWDVVDLIEFKGEKESEWIRIGYYRKPAEKLNWGSQTTITEPISIWKRILIKTAREKKWFRDLLNDVIHEL